MQSNKERMGTASGFPFFFYLISLARSQSEEIFRIFELALKFKFEEFSSWSRNTLGNI